MLGGSACSLPLPQCTEFTQVVISRDDPDRRIDFALTPLGQLVVTASNTGLTLPSLATLSPPSSRCPAARCPNGSAFLGLCSLSGATLLSLPAPNNVQPTIDILLQRETPLFRSGFEPSN